MYLLTGFLGIMAIVSPYLFGYNNDIIALWTSLILGAVLLVSSIFEGIAADRDKWEYWVAGVAGVGAVLAPFALGFSTLTAALWTLLVVGGGAIVVAWMKLFPERPNYR